MIAAAYKQDINYIYQSNGGIGSAINTGLHKARGNILAFLDADDLWLPKKLEIQLAALEQNPGVDLVFGHVQQFISPELDEDFRHSLAPYPEKPEPGYLKLTMLARRDAFYRVGLFSEEFQAGDFLDWYMRAEENGLRHLMLPDLVAKRRIHMGNTASRDQASQQDYSHVIRAALRRRRDKKH
jgi:glycosyltransferase involved in cell wall biosynthesis